MVWRVVYWRVYSGQMGDDPPALPMRRGREAAGVVAAVGPDVDGPAGRISVGDEVIAFQIADAERVVVGAGTLMPKPAALSFEQAGGLLAASTTPVHAVTAIGARAGDTLLIHAASAAVGRLAIQVARARGACVIGTASPARHEELRALRRAGTARRCYCSNAFSASRTRCISGRLSCKVSWWTALTSCSTIDVIVGLRLLRS